MKCSRCGEECRSNQAFCLKCGTPIQVVPDFNLIEAELASSVEELMEDETKNKLEESLENEKTKRYSELDYLEDEKYVTRENISKTKNIKSNIKEGRVSGQTSKINNSFQVDGIGFKDNGTENSFNDKKNSQNDNIERDKKIFKIKVAIFCVLASIIVVVAIILLTSVTKENSKDSFAVIYNQGYDYFTKKEYEKAIKEFETAKKLTENNSEDIKVNKSLLNAYDKVEGKDEQKITVLKELIKLEPSEYSYYEQLIKIYDSNSMTKEIEDLLNSVTDVSISSKLSEYSVSSPQFSMEEGKYDKYISIKLSNTNKDTIYYTVDGTEPDLTSIEYKDEIKLDQEGTYTIKAFAVNAKGVSSKVVSKNYEIQPSFIEGPEITPASGQYIKDTTITITVPEGMKCYYTYSENGIAPTVTDTEYKEPIPMLRGKNILSAVLVSASGVVSEVTQNIYQLNVARTIQYNDALALLQKYITDNNVAVLSDNNEYVKADGSIINFSYNSITIVNNCEYYVIDAIDKNTAGTTVGTTYYGVDTVTGNLVKLTTDTENAGKYKLTE